MKERILHIHNVSFSYGTSLVLEGVSLEMFEGEFVALFGPNGGGKSTLIKLILGLLHPKKGTISLLEGPPEKRRPLIGYVPQVNRFDRDFPITVQEVVLMGALSHLNWRESLPCWVEDRAKELLHQVGLGRKKEAPFSSLSGGETQRALIARALLGRPRLLILDEATSNLDKEGEKTICDLLEKEGMGILMVTHHLQAILHRAKRLFCVQRSVTLLRPDEICEHFALGLYPNRKG